MKFGETLVLLGIFVVLPTIIVWLVSRYKKHETDKRAEIALAAIEKDSDLDLEEFFKKMNPPRRSIKERLLDKLLWGCIFTIFGVCIYIALAVFGMVIDRVNANMFIGLSMVALPSLGVGIAFLINYFVGKKALKQEMEAELKHMQTKE
jgi:uncharacterized membrane protein